MTFKSRYIKAWVIFVFSQIASFAHAAPSPSQTVVFIGDSLTQGYGVKAPEAYPELVSGILKKRGLDVKIVNGGISGSVTAEADRRLRWYLKTKPDLVLLALGANDGMKGTPAKTIEANLAKAIDLAQESKIPVALLGMRMMTNLGDQYVQDFDAVFKKLSVEKKIPLMPFLLEGVALKKELNQTDMRHPNPKGHEIIAKNVADFIEPILKKAKSGGAP